MKCLPQDREIAFFLPAYNEAPNLPDVVQRAVEYLQKHAAAYQIIIVNDGSVDETAEVGRLLAQQCPHVRMVTHEVNRGYGASLRTGFSESLKSKMRWIAFCDSDGQFDPADVDKLLVAAEDYGADAVIGHRVVRADGLKRRLMGRAWNFLSSRIVGFRARDVDCGFKLFRFEALQAIHPQLRGDHATISPEILGRLHLAGFRITEVGVGHAPRMLGEQSGANFHVMWMSLRGLLDLRRTLRAGAREVETGSGTSSEPAAMERRSGSRLPAAVGEVWLWHNEAE